jgi:hypothetical protein
VTFNPQKEPKTESINVSFWTDPEFAAEIDSAAHTHNLRRAQFVRQAVRFVIDSLPKPPGNDMSDYLVIEEEFRAALDALPYIKWPRSEISDSETLKKGGE